MKQQTALLYIVALIQLLCMAIHAFPVVTHVASIIPRSDSSSGTSADFRSGELLYVALAVALCSSMVLLLFTKWIYLAHRYRHAAYSSYNSSICKASDSACHGPFYTLSAAKLHRKELHSTEKAMSGILVGLFGSPSWETKCLNFYDTSERVSFTRTRRSASSCSSQLIHCSIGFQAKTLSNGLSVNGVLPDQYSLDKSDGTSIGTGSRLVNGLQPPPLALITAVHPKDSRKGTQPTDTTCRGISLIELPETALLSPLPYINSWKPVVAKTEAIDPAPPLLDSFARSLPLKNGTHDNIIQIVANPFGVDYNSFQKPIKACCNAVSQHNSLLGGCAGDQLPEQDTIPLDVILREAPLDISMKQQEAKSPLTNSPTLHGMSLTSQPPLPSLQQSRKLSPKTGSSPLRTMFLPNDKVSSSTEPTSDHGYLFPIAPLTVKPMRSKKSTLVHKNQTLDSDLYGLIQELVWETEAWDQSVFVDDRFKAMIDGSRQPTVTISDTRTTATSQKTRIRRSYRSRQPLWNVLEDIPEIEDALFLESST